MSNKLLRVVLAAMIAFLPLQGQLYAATTTLSSATIISQGTLGAVSTLDVTVRNSADDSANLTGLGFNAGAGSTVVTSPQYLDVSFNDNTAGFQAVTIATNNRDVAASPKYTGPAQGSGMVGVTDTTVTSPLLWVVFDSTQINGAGVNGGKGYAFNNPLKTDREYFVQDKRQGEADTGTDWDGDGIGGAKPYNAGFASIVFGVSNKDASLAKAPEDKNPTVDDDSNAATPKEIDGPNRTTTDGNIKVYTATDYTGLSAQDYKTNKLLLELVTIS